VCTTPVRIGTIALPTRIYSRCINTSNRIDTNNRVAGTTIWRGGSILLYIHSIYYITIPTADLFLQNLFRQCIGQWFNSLIDKAHLVLNYH
jgi:hypothetical protein